MSKPYFGIFWPIHCMGLGTFRAFGGLRLEAPQDLPRILWVQCQLYGLTGFWGLGFRV